MFMWGLFPFIPAIILLTISFFVVFTAKKTDSKALKTFGMTIAILLWVLAGLLLIISIYFGITGRCSGVGWKFPYMHPWQYHQAR